MNTSTVRHYYKNRIKAKLSSAPKGAHYMKKDVGRVFRPAKDGTIMFMPASCHEVHKGMTNKVRHELFATLPATKQDTK